MKKTVVMIMAFILCIGVTACTSDNGVKSDIDVRTINGFTIEVKADAITKTGIEFIINNQTDELYTTGEWYLIERKSGSNWYKISYIVSEDSVFWNEVAWLIPANDSFASSVDWKKLYGELDSGDYRIIKDINTTYVAGEFTIE